VKYSHSDLSFLKEPQPWKDEVGFRVATKELIASALYEIALLKALLEAPEYSANEKIEFADMIQQWMEMAGEFYDGPWPNAITPAELQRLK
jgi:hypothetical protein